MPDLLLELRSEEIPARMQRKAAGDLRKMVTDGLVEAGLTYEGCQEYWTPRRLVLDLRGLTARSKDVREEIKGPSTKAPEQAIQGFLRKAGLSSIAEAHVHSDPRKGDFYVAHIAKPGRAAEEIIAELVPQVIRSFPWPKSMRWGAGPEPIPMLREDGSPLLREDGKPYLREQPWLRWVRPLRSIVCTFGPETSDPVVVDFEVDGIRSGNVTYGHRFHAPEAIAVRRFDDYVAKLEAAKVIVDAERRKQIILADARNLAFANGLDLVEDDGLLEEVSGLVEWPVVLMGSFEEAYLDIPPEVIRLTIRANQKCFVSRPHGEAEKLTNRFLLTANIEAKDGGVEIVHGNGKVVRARLSDALYFWRTDQANLPDLDDLKGSAARFGLDLSKPLDQRMARLDRLGVTFHAKLGTQGERVQRIARLAEEIAATLSTSPLWGGRAEGAGGGNPSETPPPLTPPHKGEGDLPALARRAAILAKADLQTEVVGEFPELQGAMGRKYALLQGEHPSVAAAIEEHYKPQGPSDSIPTDPVSIAVALADKLDTLTGFWAIDEKPTGSKDPYALRRAALGVVRIMVENAVTASLLTIFRAAGSALVDQKARREVREVEREAGLVVEFGFDRPDRGDKLRALAEHAIGSPDSVGGMIVNLVEMEGDLLAFFHERLKVYLRDKGARHDLIDAVISPSADDLLAIVRRVEALGALLDTEDGRNLLAGTKRAANILAAEQKKGTDIAAAVDPALFSEPEERALSAAVARAEAEAARALDGQDYEAAMRAMASLRAPIDAFFDKVLVNDDDLAVRANRLALLARIRAATAQVADFSRIAG